MRFETLLHTDESNKAAARIENVCLAPIRGLWQSRTITVEKKGNDYDFTCKETRNVSDYWLKSIGSFCLEPQGNAIAFLYNLFVWAPFALASVTLLGVTSAVLAIPLVADLLVKNIFGSKKNKEHQKIVEKILEYQEMSKLDSTYTAAISQAERSIQECYQKITDIEIKIPQLAEGVRKHGITFDPTEMSREQERYTLELENAKRDKLSHEAKKRDLKVTLEKRKIEITELIQAYMDTKTKKT